MNRFVWVVLLLGVSVCQAAGGFVVVDGDSLEYQGERIRILDIDAPEFLQKCYDGSGWQYRCGFEAKEYLRKLVSGNVRCERFGKDRYGRSLMDCYTANGVNVGSEMVRQGQAVAYSDRYQKEEREAKAAKRGIWQGKFMRPELYRALKKSHETLKKNTKR